MPTPEKAQILQETAENIRDVGGMFLADFSGMSVEKLSLLRKKCRDQDIRFKVLKNTLLKRSLNERGITTLDPYLNGPTGLVYSPKDSVAPAKVLVDFAKEHERPKVKAAVVDGHLFDEKAIARLAQLPSREVLLQQVLGTVIAPMTMLLGAVNSLLGSPATLAGALEAKQNPNA
jgi:large subunit ribosomal protein L10